ncbi:MAG: hypothetical protein V1902_02130 [Candidatus Falkowbacteria bacterium]
MVRKSLWQIFFIFFGIVIFLFPVGLVAANSAMASSSKLSSYVEYFYDRHSNYLDGGLQYAAPDYGITTFKKPETAREWMALTAFYKYRAMNNDAKAKIIIQQGIWNAYDDLVQRPPHTQSFADSEAQFLMVRMIESVPSLLTEKEKSKVLSLVKGYIEGGILAKDLENRAIVAAAHWQYLVNYLYENNFIDGQTKQEIDGLLFAKINAAIKTSIDKNGWYFETKQKLFSTHYQVVSAFSLLAFGSMTNEQKYLDLAKKMYFNIKKISFINGLVEAKIGHRPIGNGAQFYLMQGLLGKYFGDEDYKVYLFYGSGNRFFSDKERPNRLEFHSTIEDSAPRYHDDYAFSDAAELALTLPALDDIDWTGKYFFDNPARAFFADLLKIKNSGKTVIVNNRKFILGTVGNFSKIVKLGV